MTSTMENKGKDSDKQGRPLYMVPTMGDEQTTDMLLTEKVPPDRYRSEYHPCNTPLHASSKHGHEPVVQSLLSHDFQSESHRTALYYACEEGQIHVVSALLQSGSDPEKATKDGSTPLSIACEKNHEKIVQLLLSACANVNKSNDMGDCPLHIAARIGHGNIVKKLLEAGAIFNVKNQRGYTPLIQACYHGHLGVVKILVQAGSDLEESSNNKCTPLYVASNKGHLKIVEILVEAGANVNAKQLEGHTPLIVASELGHCNVVKTLVNNGSNVMDTDKNGNTAVHWAALNGHLEVVKVLLETLDGFQCLCMKGFKKKTPLERAEMEGKLDVADYLRHLQEKRRAEFITYSFLEACSTEEEEHSEIPKHTAFDINVQQDDGSTPLIIAAERGHSQTVKILLKAKADTEMKRHDGNCALLIATEKGYSDIVELILAAGASTEIQRKDGATPLSIAAQKLLGAPKWEQRGHMEILRQLLTYGAIMDSPMEMGMTILHIASAKGNLHIVKLLIIAGANLELQTPEGHTPLHKASQAGNRDVVAELLKAGADTESRTNDGSTPLLLACQEGKPEVIHELLSKGANPNAQRIDGAAPLHIASENASYQLDIFRESKDAYADIVVSLLEAGAYADIRTQHGRSPLHIASWRGNVHIGQHLLNFGAQKNSKTVKGETPLHFAAMEGHIEMVEALLHRGKIDIDTRTCDGNTALHLASERGHTDVVEILIKASADPELPNINGWRALHFASKEGNTDIVQMLLDRRSFTDVKTTEGETPLSLAKEGHQEICKLLKKAGADKKVGHIAKILLQNIGVYTSQTVYAPDIEAVAGAENADDDRSIITICENVEEILDVAETCICAFRKDCLGLSPDVHAITKALEDILTTQMERKCLQKSGSNGKAGLVIFETGAVNGETAFYGLYFQGTENLNDPHTLDREPYVPFIYMWQMNHIYISVGRQLKCYKTKTKFTQKDDIFSYLSEQLQMCVDLELVAIESELVDWSFMPLFVCRDSSYFEAFKTLLSNTNGTQENDSHFGRQLSHVQERSSGNKYIQTVSQGLDLLQNNPGGSKCAIFTSPDKAISSCMIRKLMNTIRRKCKTDNLQVILTTQFPETMDYCLKYVRVRPTEHSQQSPGI